MKTPPQKKLLDGSIKVGDKIKATVTDGKIELVKENT